MFRRAGGDAAACGIIATQPPRACRQQRPAGNYAMHDRVMILNFALCTVPFSYRRLYPAIHFSTIDLIARARKFSKMRAIAEAEC